MNYFQLINILKTFDIPTSSIQADWIIKNLEIDNFFDGYALTYLSILIGKGMDDEKAELLFDTMDLEYSDIAS